jgi:hypothetical protein
MAVFKGMMAQGTADRRRSISSRRLFFRQTATASISENGPLNWDEDRVRANSILPLFASFGAAGSNMRAERLHSSAAYSVLRMDLFAFRRIRLWRSDRASIPV